MSILGIAHVTGQDLKRTERLLTIPQPVMQKSGDSLYILNSHKTISRFISLINTLIRGEMVEGLYI